MDDTDELPDDRKAALEAQFHSVRAIEDRFGPEDMAEWRGHGAE